MQRTGPKTSGLFFALPGAFSKESPNPEGAEKKRAYEKNVGPLFMVRLERFERPTPRFVVCELALSASLLLFYDLLFFLDY